jgi:hypothetical protein
MDWQLNNEFRYVHELADFICDVNRRGRKWHLHPTCEQTRTRILSVTTDEVLCRIIYWIRNTDARRIYQALAVPRYIGLVNLRTGELRTKSGLECLDCGVIPTLVCR